MGDYFKEAKKAIANRDFQKAGDLYVLGGDREAAIESYLQGNLYELAARLYEKDQDYRNAARYFDAGRNYEKAANLYVSISDFKRASEAFEKANDLGRASEMAQRAGDLASAASLADRAGKFDRAAELYVKVQNYDRAATICMQLMEQFIREKKDQGHLEITVVRLRKYANMAGSLNARLQHYEKAARCFEEAENFPKAAECHARGGRYDRAAELFVDGSDYANASINFEKSGKLLKASEMAEKAGDFARAAAFAEKTGQIERAAALYMKIDQIQKAVDLLFQVIIKGIDEKANNKFLDTSRMAFRRNAGAAASLYLRLNQPARAAWCLEQAESYLKAAECYEKAQNLQKAAELYHRGGNNARAYEMMTAPESAAPKPEVLAEVCFQLGKFAEAGDLFMIAQNSVRAAEAFQKSGNSYKAAVLFEDVNQPDKAAALYVELKEYKKAAPLLVSAGKLKEAGEIYLLMDEPDRALEVFIQGGAKLAAARILGEKDPQRAAGLLQEIPTDHEDYRPACELMGDLFAAQDMDVVAVQKYKEALYETALDTSTMDKFYKLACSYDKVHQYENALPLFDSLLSMDLGYKDVLQRVERLKHRSDPGGMPMFEEDSSAVRRMIDQYKVSPANEPAPPPPAPVSHPEAPAAETQSLVGKKIREYEILEEVGKGGMGSVYRARHIFLDKERAIKVIESKLAGTDFAQRFIREARILSDLHSPYLVQLFEFGVLDEDQFFMVLEFIEGESAKLRVKTLGRIPFPEAVRIVREAAMGLMVAHEKGIIHRDMSPDNLMLVKDDQGAETTKVIDFGIAKPLSEITEGMTSTNMFLGKPEFASPEQCGFLQEGESIDHRTDIYSLAITFYCMVTGKLPFYSPTPQGYLVKHLTGDPKPLSEYFPTGHIPKPIDDLILKALHKNRENRHSTMAEFLHELENACL